jgi:hypothetical protein
VNAGERNQVHPLMVFEETSELDNEHWLTDWPVSACRKHKLGKSPMLCSGSVMGSREGILDTSNRWRKNSSIGGREKIAA